MSILPQLFILCALRLKFATGLLIVRAQDIVHIFCRTLYLTPGSGHRAPTTEGQDRANSSLRARHSFWDVISEGLAQLPIMLSRTLIPDVYFKAAGRECSYPLLPPDALPTAQASLSTVIEPAG